MATEPFENVAAGELHPEHWPSFRPRLDVRARRVGHPFTFEQRLYRDGYLVTLPEGGLAVVTVAEFEAVYELAGRHG